MDPFVTLAFGVDLHLVSTAEGGRHTPLLGGTEKQNRFNYRPNWGLPGWTDGEQTAGPVFGFSTIDINPGDDTAAIFVAVFRDNVPEWELVEVGDVLRMYEGSRICGVATVRWIELTTWPATEADESRFTSWLMQR